MTCTLRRQQVAARSDGLNTDGEHSERTRRGDDRVLIARIAAAQRWGRASDRTAATEPARRGLRANVERESDPDGALSAQEVVGEQIN